MKVILFVFLLFIISVRAYSQDARLRVEFSSYEFTNITADMDEIISEAKKSLAENGYNIVEENPKIMFHFLYGVVYEDSGYIGTLSSLVVLYEDGKPASYNYNFPNIFKRYTLEECTPKVIADIRKVISDLSGKYR